MLSPELIAFVTGPVLLVLGTANASGRNAIGRGAGLAVLDGGRSVEVVVSRWQWPQVVQDVLDTGRATLTVAQAETYEAYQLKGRAALRAATDADQACSRQYVNAIHARLQSLGVPPVSIEAGISARDPLVLTLHLEQVFHQTPGPSAGQPLENAQ